MQRVRTRFVVPALVPAVFLFWCAGVFGQDGAAAAKQPKNVILMIADGAGFNSWLATEFYHGRHGKEIYQGEGWFQVACTTFPLNTSSKPKKSGKQDEAVVYDPAKAWDAETGYRYLKSTATDSAAAGTALATGIKTYNNAINWTDDDQPMTGKTLPEIAHGLGKSAGVVTSVQWSHATPATLGGAHNVSRNNYAEIAREMLGADYLQVIMGAGHPCYDNDGRKKTDDPSDKDCQYVGGREVWDKLTSGRHPSGWTLVQTVEEFAQLTQGDTPAKVVGTAQVATTLQQGRGGALGLVKEAIFKSKPFENPKNQNVPTLELMTRAALNVLDNNPHGFFLMIEGGAVDWANHANQEARMIEEQTDFLAAVQAVCDWVEKHSSWDETLVILTADHDCGLPWGPESDVQPFQPIVDAGAGNMPGLRYNHSGHSNSLVPVFAKGSGAARLSEFVRGKDERAGKIWGFSGDYIDNTDVFRLIESTLRAGQ
ncbi:alkaline phosphatase [Thermopirellula anaerolimosa]